jgi:hypothetical protein
MQQPIYGWLAIEKNTSRTILKSFLFLTKYPITLKYN